MTSRYMPNELINAPNIIPASDIGAPAPVSLIIAVYAIVSILMASFRLLNSDITKKAAQRELKETQLSNFENDERHSLSSSKRRDIVQFGSFTNRRRRQIV